VHSRLKLFPRSRSPLTSFLYSWPPSRECSKCAAPVFPYFSRAPPMSRPLFQPPESVQWLPQARVFPRLARFCRGMQLLQQPLTYFSFPILACHFCTRLDFKAPLKVSSTSVFPRGFPVACGVKKQHNTGKTEIRKKHKQWKRENIMSTVESQPFLKRTRRSWVAEPH